MMKSEALPMTPDIQRPMRKIVAWVYWSTNWRHGYAARLECGHERMDLTNVKDRAHDALCWECEPEEVLTTVSQNQEKQP